MRRFAILTLVAAVSALANASAIDRLHSFLTDTKSLRASFTQVVTDKNGRKVQDASGTLSLARPGKFRWNYDLPYKQTIVGDGSKVWIYDVDLNQVIVRKLDAALGSTPAALLAGGSDVERAFTLVAQAGSDDLEWLEATPKNPESTFASVRMGFDAAGIARMELKDNFGQTTQLVFSHVERNAKVGAGDFRFVPPQGADVIEE
jgi:outer membrane lipoprotein carrier protein